MVLLGGQGLVAVTADAATDEETIRAALRRLNPEFHQSDSAWPALARLVAALEAAAGLQRETDVLLAERTAKLEALQDALRAISFIGGDFVPTDDCPRVLAKARGIALLATSENPHDRARAFALAAASPSLAALPQHSAPVPIAHSEGGTSREHAERGGGAATVAASPAPAKDAAPVPVTPLQEDAAGSTAVGTGAASPSLAGQVADRLIAEHSETLRKLDDEPGLGAQPGEEPPDVRADAEAVRAGLSLWRKVSDGCVRDGYAALDRLTARASQAVGAERADKELAGQNEEAT